MKQKIYILGMISGMVLVTGAMFKVNHWPAAGILLTLGTLMLVFLFLPAALYDHYKAYGTDKTDLYILLPILHALLYSLQCCLK